MRKYGENLLFFCWVNNISLTLSENKKLCVLCWRSGGVVSFLLSVSARICLCQFNSISFSYAEFTFSSHHSCHLFCYILSSVPHLCHRCCLRSAWANFVVNKRRERRDIREKWIEIYWMAWQATLKSSSANAGKKFSESFFRGLQPGWLGAFLPRVTTRKLSRAVGKLPKIDITEVSLHIVRWDGRKELSMKFKRFDLF